MSGYLLDTHVLLWWLSDPQRLSDDARAVIADSANAVHISAAAVWEMAIKKALSRLDYPANLLEVLDNDDISVIPIYAEHALAVAELPPHHQDPFDRIQIAQARVEGLTIITCDEQFARYDVAVLRA